jgi:hypothetical protein
MPSAKAANSSRNWTNWFVWGTYCLLPPPGEKKDMSNGDRLINKPKALLEAELDRAVKGRNDIARLLKDKHSPPALLVQYRVMLTEFKESEKLTRRSLALLKDRNR